MCVYFLMSLSFSYAWLGEPWLPLGPMMFHIEIICICTLDHIKGDSYSYNSTVASTDRYDYSYVWEGTTHVFCGLAGPCSVHLPHEVELARVLSCHWMFFLERYIKTLNGSVWKMVKLKGFMEEG